MMNTLFAIAPFRRFDLGTHALLRRDGTPRLGQGVFSSLLKDIGIPSSIDNLIKDLPAEEQSFNQAKWNECVKMGLTTTKGAACALAVIEEINAGKTSPAKGATPPVATAPSSFPVVPVVLGLAAAGGLVWYLSTRKK